jgi:hypothetical protein
MINLVNKKCRFTNCSSRPSYGNTLVGRNHCVNHFDKKSEWKITTCVKSNCKSIAMWSKTGNYPFEFCDNCVSTVENKDNDYKSIHAGTCSMCNLTNLLLDSDKKCLLSCSDINKHRMKFSENSMKNMFIEQNFKFINDVRVDESCGKRRPDFVFDLGFGILIVENDEDQHKSRTCECEQKRMIEIHNDYGGLPVHFIRFNPDNYKEKNNCDNEHLDIRLAKLCSVLRTLINSCAQQFFERYKYLSVSYLYYDNYENKSKLVVNAINY